MTVRGIPMRAILIPTGAAALSIALLSWYVLFYIPSHQEILNEQRSRQLRTTSVQIQTKVNNFDSAIDHAVESFHDSIYSNDFRQYIKEFAPNLDIPERQTEMLADQDNNRRLSDPPSVKIERDEGTEYLYLFYKSTDSGRAAGPLIVRADIESFLSGDLSSTTDFDAVAIVEHDGSVIAQNSTIGVTLTRAEQLINKQSPTAPATAKTLIGTGNLTDISVVGAEYRLYVQPIPLSLKHRDGSPEEWALCGLVRTDRVRAESSAISPTYWLTCIGALVVLVLAIPLLKLRILHPRERFHRTDGVLVAGASFLIVALLTFGLLEGYYYHFVLQKEVDRQLSHLSDQLTKNLNSEAEAAIREVDRLGGELEKSNLQKSPPTISNGSSGKCNPPEACKKPLLSEKSDFLEKSQYPYFNLISGTDVEGQQLIKWTPFPTLTPFINIHDAKLAYYDDLVEAHRKGKTQYGISVLQSPNTAQNLTVFWRALPDKNSVLSAISLATIPLSVVKPVLPANEEFAIVDINGDVQFHSDPKRSLHENFFEESRNNPKLQALVKQRVSNTLTANYLGRPHRLFVTPITFDKPAHPELIRDPGWSLIVFQDSDIAATQNLETLTVAALLFVAYGLVLAVGWGVLHGLWRKDMAKWFWPDSSKSKNYLYVTVVNGLLAATFLGAIAIGSAELLIAATGLISAGALAATFYLVRKKFPSISESAWRYKFLSARTSLLLVLSAVPAMACFTIGCDFEMRLLNRWTRVHLADDIDHARPARIERDIASLGLCGEHTITCENTSRFCEKRNGVRWDVPVSVDQIAVGGSTPVDGLLSWLHLPFNKFAADLTTALIQPAGAGPNAARSHLGTFWLIALAVAVAFCIFLLVRFAIQRLFVLKVYDSPTLSPAPEGNFTGNVVLVGPLASGKMDTLRKQKNALVLDATEFQLWIDNGGAVTLSKGAVIGIDHLEYRFGDASFRQSLREFLEEEIQGGNLRVWISSAQDLFQMLQESGAPDLDRWRLVLQSFRLEAVAMNTPDPSQEPTIEEAFTKKIGDKPPFKDLLFDECLAAPQLVAIATEVIERLPAGRLPEWKETFIAEMGIAAEPFHQSIWATCSKDEKLALRQLAEEGVVNPNNREVIARLLRTGLIRRNPTFRLMNESFRRFVVQRRQSDGLAAWEREGVNRPWGSVTATLLSVALGLTALLILSQQQLVESWASFVPLLAPALAPAFPTVARLVASIQLGSKATKEL